MLEKLRKEIDQIDDKLLNLFNQRIAVVQKVGKLKRNTKAPIYRPEREKAIIDRLAREHKGLLNKSAIEAIFWKFLQLVEIMSCQNALLTWALTEVLHIKQLNLVMVLSVIISL